MPGQNLHPHQDKKSTFSRPLTPRDIVNKQIADYHYHVTEEDLDRMIITDKLSTDQREEVARQSDALSKQHTNTSYEVLDNS